MTEHDPERIEPTPEAGPAPRPDAPPEAPRDAGPGQPPRGDDPTPPQDPDPAADPEPLGVARTPTGVPGIDAQLDRLADADHLGVSGHPEVYEDVHRGLRDALTALDRRPGPTPPAPYDTRS
jgi:hypothetical protein